MSQDHVDVIIVGAGLSGIGAAYHLQKNCPGKSYAILEGRDAIGGTWDIFRYPGIRSDSDMHTLGYNFKPWRGAKAIADGTSIREYVNETADENNIRENIRFNSMVKAANWSSETATWTLEIENPETGERSTATCNFVSMCSGYYSYKEGYTPEFKGIEGYQGQIVHPQKWPENLDYAGKKVVVIGSGATAMTLVPSMSDDAEHVTMVQRRSTWVASRPAEDVLANRLRKYLPEKLAYAITRFKNVTGQQMIYGQSRTNPDRVRKELLGLAKQELPSEYVDEHFTPDYNPWDERLCLIPDNDLFNAINKGDVSIVTNTIEGFTENGLELTGGEVLEADIIITATGLNMVQLGEADITVDGAPVNFADTWSYKGMMYSGVPNLLTTFGYINASWTLRADLMAEWTCRLLNHMGRVGKAVVTPTLSAEYADMEQRDMILDFSPNYMKRTMHLLPKQGTKEPWLNAQDYTIDKKMMRKAPIDDGALVFSDAVDVAVAREAAE
jgi:monooxygenase